MLNFTALSDATLNTDPYPFMVVNNAIVADKLAQVTADFPTVDYAGSLPVSEVTGGAYFDALIEQLNGDEFRQVIEQKFALNLLNHPVMTTVRGVMRTKDGRIHTDSKTKVITVLIYFNAEWEQEGGRLRILRDGKDIENYVAEIPPLTGTMVAFKVTDNCWHGHTPVEGKRQSIQLNFLTGDAAKGKHQFFHRISAKLKKTFGK